MGRELCRCRGTCLFFSALRVVSIQVPSRSICESKAGACSKRRPLSGKGPIRRAFIMQTLFTWHGIMRQITRGTYKRTRYACLIDDETQTRDPSLRPYHPDDGWFLVRQTSWQQNRPTTAALPVLTPGGNVALSDPKWTVIVSTNSSVNGTRSRK